MNDSFSTITIESGLLENFDSSIESFIRRASHVCILSDNTVMAQYGDSLQQQLKGFGTPLSTHIIPQGESNKNLDVALSCWSALEEKGMDRSSVLIALGGGSVTDLAGFVASTFMRGISLICIPTTLVGMCDAAIGGKTGVNFQGRKNLIGSFYPAHNILIDPATLVSLPDRELRSGLAEVIKYGVIADADFFCWLQENIPLILKRDPAALTHAISRSCRIKCNIVDNDPFDQAARAQLNFGHTFGHAIESATNYQQYLHGEAVAIGMRCAATLSQQLGFVDHQFEQQVIEICQKAQLPTELPSASDDAIIEQMQLDKKTKRGTITCIVAKKLGEVVKLDNIAPQIVRESLLLCRKLAAPVS